LGIYYIAVLLDQGDRKCLKNSAGTPKYKWKKLTQMDLELTGMIGLN
jgi:hypothetical protein